MKISKITVSKDARKDILDLLDKSVDAEGYIVEKDDPSQKVLTPKGEEIHLKEWGGIVKGSEAFIKSDAISLTELAKRLE